MKYTGNYKLKKPEGSDIVNIDDLNDNADIIDTELNKKVVKVSGKGLSTNDYTTAEKNKLNRVQAGAQVNTVTSVAGKTGAVVVSKSDIGLGNIDNIKQATKVEFDSHKAEAMPLLENTKGTISARVGTGSVTNEHLRQINVSYNSTASGNKSQVNASYNSTASGSESQVNVSEDSTADNLCSQVNASKGVINNFRHSSVWGYGLGTPSVQNKKVQIESSYGVIKASGAITGNSSFADFAEYFESENEKSIPLGTIVSLGGSGKIKIAQPDDYMVGVISQTAGVILNAQGFEWKNRYLYDRYGQPILVEKEIKNEETGEIETIETPMLNENWDENEEYIAREDRPEWNVVGLTGQIFVNVDNTVQEGDFIKVGENGIATKGRNEYGQNWQVMKITTPYQESLGFGIGVVFVR